MSHDGISGKIGRDSELRVLGRAGRNFTMSHEVVSTIIERVKVATPDTQKQDEQNIAWKYLQTFERHNPRRFTRHTRVSPESVVGVVSVASVDFADVSAADVSVAEGFESGLPSSMSEYSFFDAMQTHINDKTAFMPENTTTARQNICAFCAFCHRFEASFVTHVHL